MVFERPSSCLAEVDGVSVMSLGSAQMTDLGVGAANGINTAGQVVGSSQCNGR